MNGFLHHNLADRHKISNWLVSLDCNIIQLQNILALTDCLKPTAVCWGAFLMACSNLIWASEYSNWMALMRPEMKAVICIYTHTPKHTSMTDKRLCSCRAGQPLQTTSKYTVPSLPVWVNRQFYAVTYFFFSTQRTGQIALEWNTAKLVTVTVTTECAITFKWHSESFLTSNKSTVKHPRWDSLSRSTHLCNTKSVPTHCWTHVLGR